MKRRFFSAQIPEPGCELSLAAEESRHLATVLRLKQPEPVILLDGAGVEAEALAQPGSGRRDPVRCLIRSRRRHQRPACRPVLYVAPPRGKHMDVIIRQATELGAAVIQPVRCARGVSEPDRNVIGSWQATAREAIKQSGNPFLPEIAAAIDFAVAASALSGPQIVGATPLEAAAAAPQSAADRVAAAADGNVGVWVGPEGGFTADEYQALVDRGAMPVAVGPAVLRVETAVVALLSWVWIAARRTAADALPW